MINHGRKDNTVKVQPIHLNQSYKPPDRVTSMGTVNMHCKKIRPMVIKASARSDLRSSGLYREQVKEAEKTRLEKMAHRDKTCLPGNVKRGSLRSFQQEAALPRPPGRAWSLCSTSTAPRLCSARTRKPASSPDPVLAAQGHLCVARGEDI